MVFGVISKWINIVSLTTSYDRLSGYMYTHSQVFVGVYIYIVPERIEEKNMLLFE